MPGRTIVVAQSSLECAALRFAASELAKDGDAVLLVHAAAVLPPSSTVLHSAPQTVFTVPTGNVNVSELHEKVTRTVKKKVLPCAEGTGAQVALQVKLLDSQAPPRDAAEAIISAAHEAGATVLVVSRDDSGSGGATPGTPRAGTPNRTEREDNSAADASGSGNGGASVGNVLGKVAADVARARANTGAAITRLVKGPTLADELLRRSGEEGGLAVVLVPAGWGEGEDSGAAAAAPAGAGAEAQA